MFVASETKPLGQRLVLQVFPNDGESFFYGLEELTNAGGLPAGLEVTTDYVYVPFYF